jgi:hypothetical protein
MAHLFAHPHYSHRSHVHLVALLLLAAVVLFVTFTVPSHRSTPEPRYGSPPATAPR